VALGWKRIALCGTSELGEIAALCARERGIAPLGFIVFDTGDPAEQFAGLAMIRSLTAISPIDAVIVTDLSNPQATFETLREHAAEERIFTPRLLRIARANATVPRRGESQ
jgi:hypothetical protein